MPKFVARQQARGSAAWLSNFGYITIGIQSPARQRETKRLDCLPLHNLAVRRSDLCTPTLGFVPSVAGVVIDMFSHASSETSTILSSVGGDIRGFNSGPLLVAGQDNPRRQKPSEHDERQLLRLSGFKVW